MAGPNVLQSPRREVDAMAGARVHPVNPYFLLPLVGSLACLVCGVVVLMRDPGATTNRCAAALMAGGSLWGVCEALWTLAPDAATAETIMRLSAPGWVFAGPLCMHLFLAQERHGSPRLSWMLPSAYAFGALCLAGFWLEPAFGGAWLTIEMKPVAWGWAYRTGPLYPVWYGFTVVTSSTGVIAALAGLGRESSPAEQLQRPWINTGIGVPMLVGSTTDGLLPALGVDVPRLGVVSFAVFGSIVALSMHRFGYSVLAPSTFAHRILDSLPEGVALITPSGHVRVANASLARLLDAPLAALRDRAVATFLPDLALAPELEVTERECELATPSGTLPIALSATPLRDRRGARIGLVLVVRDLREVVMLRSQLLTSARLAAVGELAAGIAHEINNPLAYIGANLRALRETWTALGEALRDDDSKQLALELVDEGASMLDDSLEGVERAAAIVRDVRAFSRGGGEDAAPFDPNEVLQRALRVAAPHLRHRIRVQSMLGTVGLVEGARREIEQVFLNLIVNAAQAIQGAGVLRVRTSVIGNELEVAIADDGPGIPPEHLERIFDPFFTTKPVGEGTGLGLSISHEIVRRNGGRITVSSSVGVGTEFVVRLPLAQPRES
jgi:signal transduction histidine kinase